MSDKSSDRPGPLSWDKGVRQAMTWLRADYPYGTGPDWRENGAEWGHNAACKTGDFCSAHRMPDEYNAALAPAPDPNEVFAEGYRTGQEVAAENAPAPGDEGGDRG